MSRVTAGPNHALASSDALRVVCQTTREVVHRAAVCQITSEESIP